MNNAAQIVVPFTKLIVKLVVSAGVGTIVKNAVLATSPVGMNPMTKATVVVGGAVLGMMAGDAVARYSETTIDGYVKVLSDLREPLMNLFSSVD